MSNKYKATNPRDLKDDLIEMTTLASSHSAHDIEGDRIATSIDLLTTIFDARIGQLLQAIDGNTSAIKGLNRE